jgi:hypothetical protein
MPDQILKGSHLSTIIDGVEATAVLFGVSVRVVVTAEALQARFGATSEPTSWLEAFDENTETIYQAAKRSYKAGKATMVLQSI